MLLSPDCRRRAREKQNRHDGEQRPPLFAIADHLAEGVGQSRADRKDREHLEQIGQRRRILIRMRRVGVHEAAAVGAELLDDFLRRDRPLRDRLRSALERLRIHVRTEVIRHALPDEKQREDKRERKQHPQRRAREIDPEIADRLGAAPRETANHRRRHRDSRRRRKKVVRRQPDHLRQVAQRLLARICLPVGVGRKARRRIERQSRRHSSQPLRIQRQVILKPLQRVQKDHRDKAEREHRYRVWSPTDLDAWVYSAKLVNQSLDWREHRVQKGALVREYSRHVQPERHAYRRHQDEVDGELNDRIG